MLYAYSTDHRGRARFSCRRRRRCHPMSLQRLPMTRPPTPWTSRSL